MKIPLIALAIAGLAAGAHANDADTPATAGTALVSNNHGGYNVVQPGARPHTVYHKKYFATAEEAEAARLKQ